MSDTSPPPSGDQITPNAIGIRHNGGNKPKPPVSREDIMLGGIAGFRHNGGDRASGCMTQGWYWVPGGLAVDRPAPILMGPALEGSINTPDVGAGAAPGTVQLVIGTGFPDGAWDPLLYGAAVAAEFTIAAAAVTGTPAMSGWDRLQTAAGAPSTDEASIRTELAYLWHLKNTMRKDRKDAIAAQALDFTTYFADVLACSPASRPATWRLVLIGLQIGGLVVTKLKSHFMRPRPAQVWPALSPDIFTPPHPAFPSGHALQAFLIADCVAAAAPPMASAVNWLANEIAFNREVAGVHWPTDTEASSLLRPKVMEILEPIPAFTRVLAAAKAEWPNDAGFQAVSPPSAPSSSFK